jgi:RHS repeat-associated protein
MEGNLQIHPGDPLRAGFDFTMPGSHPAATVSIYNASVSLLVKCSNGLTPALAIMLPAQTITDTASSSGWYPSGDQSSSLVYQGTLTAPDLCGGGVMNDASGAIFTATFFSTDTTDKVNFRFHYSDNTSGSWSVTVQGTPTPFAKTVTSSSLTPALSLSLARDHITAIPGDTITYTATVMNTGATLALAGDLFASDTGGATATVKSYWDTVYTSLDGSIWTPLAGAAATATGYTPAVPAPTSSGMTLSATSVPATGVTYPSTGDRILATTIAAGKTASWHYTASIPLTPTQVANLLDPTKVKKIRNSFHLEVSPANPNVTQPAIVNVDYSGLFFGAAPSASIGNVIVTIQPPLNTAPLLFNSANTPALATLASGASAPVSGTFKVPVPAAKPTGQSDSAYFAALSAVEGTALKASATASGTAPTGNVAAATPPQVTTTEHLPIVSIAKSGPATIAAGTSETNPLSLTNNGGAVASGMVVADVVPSGSAGTVTGVPATLAPAANASASASFSVPSGQPAGSLTDTASLSWQDANGNAYGPVSSSFTTTVSNNLAGASLTLSPANAGPDVVGATQSFSAVLLDRNGSAIANQAVTLDITGANPTSQAASTNSSGGVSFSYSGANHGIDQVQASVISGALTLQSNTVSVSWIAPVVPASTTVVTGQFYPVTCQCFNATPALTPVFSQEMPTININPPTGTVPHMPPSIGTDNRPMVSVATDVLGNFSGSTILQGTDANGVLHQAGSGDLFEYQAVFTGSVTIANAGPLTFSFFSDDGFIFGLGGGATRVSGSLVNPPASGLTAFTGYPVMGSFNAPSGPQRRDVIVSFPNPGMYAYEIDYFECCGDGLAFTVGIAGATGMPPTGNLALSPYIVSAKQVGQSQTLNVAAMDASGVAMANLPILLTISGANAQLIQKSADSTGLATFTYQSVNPGLDRIQASALVNGLPEISNQTTITWNPAPPAPTISTPSPADGSIVTKPVPISATFAPPAGQTIASWAVTYQALDPGPVVPLGSGTGTPPSPLVTFDPTLLPNDAYAINITATASGGGVQTLTTTVIVLGYLKPGRFVTTYQDLNVPAFGFQMQVRRTYDSFDKEQGDFGIGWRVSLNNFRVSTNRTLGAGGWTQYNLQCGLGLCLTAFRSSAPHFVTVVFPDQHTEIFDFSATGGSNIFFSGAPVYTARANTGTTSTLSSVGDTSLGYQDDGNLYNGSGQIYDPQQFKLTTLDGTALILDRTKGLVSMTDRSGNWIQVSAAGITSRNGQGISFTRDVSGRITEITDPSSHVLKYRYSPTGDLASFTDADSNLTTFEYDTDHNLLKAKGPAGQPLQTQQYDTAGRMIAITDANGNTAQITNNVAGRQQTVIDPTGRLTTVYTLDDLGDVLRQDQVFDGKTLTTRATYDVVGRPLSRTDPLGHKWVATYDGKGNLLSVGDPLSHAVGVTYDDFGAPLTFTDPVGNVSTYTYDVSGNLSTFKNALGQIDHYDYGDRGNLGHHIDALNRTWSYNEDGNGNLNVIRDAQGQSVWAYDSQGHMTSSQDPAGNVTTYAYDPAGNLTSSTDPLNKTTTFTYNALNEMVSRTDAIGKTTTYTYDGNTALRSSTDPLGNVTSYVYDAAGRQVSLTDPAGGITSYTYDGSGRLASEKDPTGRITSYVYDNAGRLVTKALPNGGVFTYAYDDAGHQTAVTDPLGHSTSYSYDDDGRLVSTTNALGKTTSYVLDALGRQVTIQDAVGKTTQHGYDAAGQLVSDTDALGKATTYGYDGAGNRTSVTDPLGHSTTYGYDQANRVSGTIDPLGRFVIPNYDALSRVTLTRLYSGIFITTTYDAVGRVTATGDGLNTTSYTYDAAGRQVSMTDPRSNTTSYGYDAAGRQTSITDPLGGKVTVAYDLAGQKTSVVNPRGDTTSFTYDSLGNLHTQTDPAGKITTYTYDLAGRQTSKSDPRGITVSNAYDAADELTAQTFPGGSIAFVYDALGRRTSMTDPSGSTGYTYDANSRPTSISAPQGTVGYGYDSAGNRTSMSLPVRGSILYTYDAANQTTKLTDWAGQAFNFTYASDGMPASVNRPGGVNTTFGYDGADRLTAIHHDGPSGAIAHFDYTLDANGNRTSVVSAAGTESYTMDVLNRLTGVSYPNSDTASYTYDAAGNRLTSRLNAATTNYTYDSPGRLTSAGANALTYDAASNVTSNGSSTFSWDWAGRLASATVGGASSTYTYDGDGTRVAAASGGATTSYLWDRNLPLPLLIDDGSQAYVQTDQGILEQLGSTATYPLSDALGSVRSLTSSTASVLGTASYDAFGSTRSQTGQSSSFGFTGQQTDPTGLSYLRARYYSPSIGRFISPDSVQPNAPGTQGYDLYGYVANNPISATDPSGNEVLGLAGISTFDRIASLGLSGITGALMVRLALMVVGALAIGAGAGALEGLWRPPAPTIDQPVGRGGQIDTGQLAKQLLRAGLGLTAAGAAAAAAACAASAEAGMLLGIGDNPCSGDKVPIFFSGTDTPRTTIHIGGAQASGKKAVLNYWRNRPHTPGLQPWESWYETTPFCDEAARSQFASENGGDRGVCDEYPFYSTTQNEETVTSVSLKFVPKAEGAPQGGNLSLFYTGCHVTGRFVVVPLALAVETDVPAPSFAWCPGR